MGTVKVKHQKDMIDKRKERTIQLLEREILIFNESYKVSAVHEGLSRYSVVKEGNFTDHHLKLVSPNNAGDRRIYKVEGRKMKDACLPLLLS